MDAETRTRRYIDLLLTALDLQPGNKLAIRSEPAHRDFVLSVAERAYRAGAAYVHVMAGDPRIHKARVDYAEPDSLSYVPDFLRDEYMTFTDGSWCLLSLVGPEFPDLLERVDAGRNAIIGKAQAEALKPFREALQSDRFAWCVAAVPTQGWAGKVFGRDAGPEGVERLWDVLVPILRLDQDNPGDAWKEHASRLQERARLLTQRHVRELHFQSTGTDLRVELLESSVWVGGGARKPSGRLFLPNVPTEEVFTTPRKTGTRGKAVVTRPVMVLGRIVTGAWFEFVDGRVEAFGAEAGSDTLERYFEIDPNARYLGEIALVDSGSPVFQSNTVFYNILYDENAACHLALGSSYPTCVEGGTGMSNEEYAEVGANQSTLHTDFMIGSSDLNVDATTFDGGSFPVMREGRFVI
ncbi:MAG: aminopeptidase [Spirochaetaceae bacterium]